MVVGTESVWGGVEVRCVTATTANTFCVVNVEKDGRTGYDPVRETASGKIYPPMTTRNAKDPR
jgi:hypothetical protein